MCIVLWARCSRCTASGERTSGRYIDYNQPIRYKKHLLTASLEYSTISFRRGDDIVTWAGMGCLAYVIYLEDREHYHSAFSTAISTMLVPFLTLSHTSVTFFIMISMTLRMLTLNSVTW